MLHPEKYAKHALRDIYQFLEGKITYPEVDLRLAGEEAWLDAYPDLRYLVHSIIMKIRGLKQRGVITDGAPLGKRERQIVYKELEPELSALEDFVQNGVLETSRLPLYTSI